MILLDWTLEITSQLSQYDVIVCATGRGRGARRRGRGLRRYAASNIFLLYFTTFIIIVSYCLPAFKIYDIKVDYTYL